jgi:acetolactate synthase regulatory subunit
MSQNQHHILSVLVENRPGVLARVASLFARRGFNIFSLAVAPAEEDTMSRIRWMWEGTRAPEEWRNAPRLTLRELVEDLAVAGHFLRRFDVIWIDSRGGQGVFESLLKVGAGDLLAFHDSHRIRKFGVGFLGSLCFGLGRNLCGCIKSFRRLVRRFGGHRRGCGRSRRGRSCSACRDRCAGPASTRSLSARPSAS